MSYLKKMEELRRSVPKIGLVAVKNENSPYVSYTGNCKNCYLLSGSEFDEDCYYGFWLYESKNTVDCDYSDKCTLCYECVDCIECYNVSFSQDCSNCTDCEYCYDCAGCGDCFGCSGLRRKQYMIGNRQFSKGEFEKKVAEIKNSRSRGQILEILEQMKLETPRLFVHELNNENSTGDYIYNNKNAHECFDSKELEDCFHCYNSISLKDCCDMNNSYYGSELNYEIMSEMNLVNCNFCVTCFDSHNLEHCEHLYNCHDCFGCFSLRHKEYCIFNEQYSKEEYFEKVDRIRREMMDSGEYFRFLPSTYPYEDSNAAMFYANDDSIC